MFQVTTNAEARVGRFSVSRAQEQSLESRQSPPLPTPAANGPGDPLPILSPDVAHKASLPSLNNNSFNNSYISSDNDSEFEDEDFKREVTRLREKQVLSLSLSLSSSRKQRAVALSTLSLLRLSTVCLLLPLRPTKIVPRFSFLSLLLFLFSRPRE